MRPIGRSPASGTKSNKEKTVTERKRNEFHFKISGTERNEFHNLANGTERNEFQKKCNGVHHWGLM